MEKKLSITNKIIVIALIVLLSVGAFVGIGYGIFTAVKTVKCEGYVFESESKLPVRNVSVTDGKNVVKTDEKGHFQIPGWFKARFITITNPSGYWTENYYIEINSEIKDYNFFLDKETENQTNHSFLQVSDTEVGAGGVGDWINDVKSVVDETNPAFLIQTGDICYPDGLRSHKDGMNSDNMGVPVRYIIGNHDYVDSSEGKYGEALFEDIYGPVCYSFEVGDVHYIVTPMMTYTEHPAKYSDSDVWRWVQRDLASKDPSKKVVIFNHDYCEDENDFEISSGGKKLKLKEYGLIAWVFGHWHYNFVNNVGGVLNISTAKPDAGGVDSSPNGVREVKLAGGTITDASMHYPKRISFEGDSGYVWQTQLKGRSMFSEPIVRGDRAYVATATDSFPAKSGITCFDTANGKIVWEYLTKNSVRNSIAFKDGKIYAQDTEGNVYCINATNGELVWTRDCLISDPKNTSKCVVVDGENVYCGSEESIYCLNAEDGAVVWQEPRSGNSTSPSRNIVYKDYLIVGSHWDRLVCYDKNSGKKLWSSSNSGMFVVSTPIVFNDKVYLTSNNNIFVYDIKNGKLIDSESFEDNEGNELYTFDTASTPYVSEGIGYYTTVNNGIVAIDLDTFESKWQFKTGKALIYTAPYSSGNSATVESSIVEKDGKLYFGASDGYVYCVDKASGTEIGKFAIGSPVLSGVTISGDNLIVADFAGRVTMLLLSAIV